MKEKRSLFQMLFGKAKEPSKQPMTGLQMLNEFTPHFTDPSLNAFEYTVVRSSIDSIARNAAKLKPKHIRRTNGQIQTTSSQLDYLLSVRPNPHMDAYSFYYKMISNLFYKNNAFAYVQLDSSGNFQAIYPIDFSRLELLEHKNEVYTQFHFLSGNKLTLPYSEVIHLRRFFYKHDIYGDMDNSALQKSLDLLHTTDEGIANAIKSSAYLRGLIRFQNSMLSPKDMKDSRDKFVEDFLDVSKKGGIAAIDAKAEYIDLKAKPEMISAEQMKVIEEKVYKYYNVSESIIKSDYTEEQWNSFYESVIEPIAIQMSLEFTSKLFTNREQAFGNEIVFESNRLQYASNNTKIAVVTMLMDRGMMTINQGLEVFNLPPVDDGDKRLVSLNFVDASIANEYQLGKTQTDPSETENEQDVGGASDDDSTEG